ncbi:MAG: hypothetical protein K2X66_02065 [Cyanobacteria bacterium]|nr:hypothetical protein [Cyanobacteriota bacterium]
MISMTPISSPHQASVKPFASINQGLKQPINTLPAFKNASQKLPGTLHFAGDALQIYKRYQNLSPEEAAFKATCDTIVWQDNGETLNVAEMIAFLCRIRPEDKYPGWGTIKTLANGIPGLEVEKLEKAFDTLHQENYFLGQYKAYTWNDSQTKLNATNTYWLREPGIKMLKHLYPSLNLPPRDLLYLDPETAITQWPDISKS